MEKYKVEIKETLAKIIKVEAFDENEAIEIVKNNYNEGKMEYILDFSDYIDTEFKVFKE